MRTVLLASLRTHTRRYVASAMAVVIGVAFIVTTAALSSATRAGLTAGVGAPYVGAGVVATGLSGPQAGRLLDAAEHDGVTARVVGSAYVDVRADGRVLDELADVGEVLPGAQGQWLDLVGGAFPSTAGQAVVDAGAAERGGVSVGDVLTLGDTGRTVRVVGTVDSPSPLAGASVFVTPDDLAPLLRSMDVESVTWSAPASSATTSAITSAVPSATVQTVDEHVSDLAATLTRGVDVVAMLVLVFAAVALFVSVLVIANTFSILFAQRQRDLALLRCVGATRRQVRRSVRLEALALGVVSSLTGLLVGTGAGVGLVALVSRRFPDAPLGTPSVSLGWYAAAGAVGLLVTLGAAWLPTRRVTRVSPLAALRPEPAAGVGSSAGRIRLGLGVLTLAAGAVLLGLSVVSSAALTMVAGGAVFSTGVLVLGPVLVPGAIRLVGGGAGTLFGSPARLAADNAVRNPRRTAATAASLLVGVTLTTAVLAGMASARSAIFAEVDADHPLDATLTASTDGGLEPGVVDRVRATDGVDRAAALPGVTAEAAGPRTTLGPVSVLAPSADALAAVARGGDLRPAADEVVVAASALGDGFVPPRIDLTVGGRTTTLHTVVADGFGPALLVTPSTLARLTPTPETTAVWVRADDGADADALSDDLDEIASTTGATADGGFSQRAYVGLQLDVVTAAVVGLLAVSVLIALVGIGNTLGLSVVERSREHALLRALGLTRRQLRVTLGAEALLLSVVVTVIGTLVGLGFAWVGVRVLIGSVVEQTPLVLPYGQLALVVLVSALAGLLASVLPARRAARTSPAAGLALE